MKLRYSPTSPFVRKVMAVAHATGQAHAIEKVPTTVADKDLVDDNPLVKMPVLRLDDGQALYDSPVICEYLDSRHDGPKLFPAHGPDRWTALRLQALGDGVMDACVLINIEARRPEATQSGEWLGRQRAKLENAARVLDREVAALEGPPTIGTVAVGVALEYIDFRVSDVDWRATAPALAGWLGDFARNDFMTATAPPST